MEVANSSAPAVAARRDRLAAWVAVFVFGYCALFLVRPPREWSVRFSDAWQSPARRVEQAVNWGLGLAGHPSPGLELRFSVYLLLICGAVPLVATACIRRSLSDMGARLPNRYGWRLFAVGVLLAIPFLVWMTRSPTIAASYVKQWRRMGPMACSAYYLIIIVLEHWILQGVVLGWCRRDFRWPPTGENVHGRDTGSFFNRVLRWLGLSQPTSGATGMGGVLAWVGLPPGCIRALLISGLLFGLVHVGKDGRELLLSFPGGLAQAWLAYRTDSWFTPCFQHLVTGGIALFLMLQ